MKCMVSFSGILEVITKKSRAGHVYYTKNVPETWDYKNGKKDFDIFVVAVMTLDQLPKLKALPIIRNQKQIKVQNRDQVAR